MKLIKRLYLFVLKSFLPMFAMTFFIVLFIVLMQFIFKWIDDIVGKGLGIDVMAELFFYAALCSVPMALPLGILLASLMTFGNLGERSELTAIKASGVPLIRIMKPLIYVVIGFAVIAFFFQNDVQPRAQVKMYTLLFSFRQKSPELEIPEGSFYTQIPGYNVFVKSKNKDTGVLRDVMIYDISRGGDNATILLADSMRMAFTGDSRFLYLHLYEGEQFENLREQRMSDRNVPFRREKFLDKEILIPFDNNFSRLDESQMRRQYVGKNITELNATIDSIGSKVDSIGNVLSRELPRVAFPMVMPQSMLSDLDRPEDNRRPAAQSLLPGRETPTPGYEMQVTNDAMSTRAKSSADADKGTAAQTVISLDSLLETLTPSRRGEVASYARRINESRELDMRFKAAYLSDEKLTMRRHEIELFKKFTLSVACIIFFFIGAPLGAIIRKGGLGTPLVISVLLFVVYYMIDNAGFKMARDAHAPVWFGCWLSTMVLLPLGVYVTYMAMNDSSAFNKDTYIRLIRRIFGLKETRNVVLKEVIVNEVNTRHAEGMLAELYGRASMWLRKNKPRQSYVGYWNRPMDTEALMSIGALTDNIVEYLGDSRDIKVVDTLNRFPVIKRLWVYRPTSKLWLKRIMMWFVPVGLPVWAVAMVYRRRLRSDMEHIRDYAMLEMKLLRNGKESTE